MARRFVEVEEEQPQGLVVATYNEAIIRFTDEEFNDPDLFKAAKIRIKSLLEAKRDHFRLAPSVSNAAFKVQASLSAAIACEEIWKTIRPLRPEHLRSKVEADGPWDFAEMVGDYQEKHWVQTPDVKLADPEPQQRPKRRGMPQFAEPPGGGSLGEEFADDESESET